MREFEPYFPNQTSISTKLMIDPSMRGSSLTLRLVKQGFQNFLRSGVRFDFIDCNPPMRPFFERLGYKQLFPDREHPVYGRVHLMVLDTHDWFHFLKIRSPFAQLLPDDGSYAPLGWKDVRRKHRSRTPTEVHTA